jgi:UDP-N-acetylglucosamine 1-carboxyvinyltransferase
MTLAQQTLKNTGYKILGKNPLRGSIEAFGAKNSVTKCLVASLLTDQVCTITNVPQIQEVEITLDMLASLGSKINWDKQTHSISIHTPHIISTKVANRFSGANRIPILLLGALIGRTSEAVEIPSVGGCQIGARPVNFHFDALKTLGVDLKIQKNEHNDLYIASAPKGLKGGIIRLEYPSLGASENALLAASWAQGVTYIHNISLEPEFLDLIHFVQKIGVIITFIDDRTIRVQKGIYRGAEHHLVSDRAFAASYAMLAYATQGEIFVKGARQEHLGNLLSIFQQIKAPFKAQNDGIVFHFSSPLEGSIQVETGPYPNFLTDMQQPLVTLLTQTKGEHRVHETVYEQRFGYTKTLNEMGANILLSNDCAGDLACRFKNQNFSHSCYILGPTPLKGKDILIPDLRAGFAYVIASLAADGISTLHNIHYLHRGYGNLLAPLSSLGADITLID